MQLTLETGEIGRQANGAVMARLGDTVCVCCESLVKSAMQHVPPAYSYCAFHVKINLLLGAQMLYSTACCEREPTGDGSFLPLQVVKCAQMCARRCIMQ